MGIDRAIVVSVGYGDLLAVTLPRNAQHCQRVLVVTSPADEETARVVAAVPNAELFVTDVFYAQGAAFNKGAAMEAGLDALGRSGQMLIWDADILFPALLPLSDIQPGYLYTPHRRMLYDPRLWQPDLDWSQCPLTDEKEFPGYFQLFHASDPVLQTRRPWYSVNWKHAGGCDSDFQSLWPGDRKKRPPFEVLHLGEDGQNWHGRATLRIDGTLPPNAQTHAEAQQRMLQARRQSKVRYPNEKLP